MQKLNWLESHLGTLDNAIELANDMQWELVILEHDGTWYVKTGESVIFQSDNKEALEAFVYGMGLAYGAGFPADIFERIKTDMKHWRESL